MKARKNVVLVALGLGLACGLAAGVTVFFLIGEQYTAVASLQVSMQQESLLPNAAPGTLVDRERFQIFKNTQQELLRRRVVLMSALRRAEVRDIPIVQYKTQYADPVEWLSGRLSVAFPGDAEVMTVSLSLDKPKDAQALVKAVVDSYVVEVVENDNSRRQKRFSELETICNDKEAEVRSKREKLRGLVASTGGQEDPETLTTRQKLLLDELTLCRQELAKSQHELQHYQVDLAVQKAYLEDAKGDARAPILKEIKRLEVTIGVMDKQVGDVANKVQTLVSEAKRVGLTNVDIQMLQADLKNMDMVLANLTNERERLRAEIRSSSRIFVLEPAQEPLVPSNLMSRLALVAVAMLVAFCCVAAIVLLCCALAHRSKTSDG
jgi:uncharacterized protein involved in exopolysaccharide biosynthesis